MADQLDFEPDDMSDGGGAAAAAPAPKIASKIQRGRGHLGTDDRAARGGVYDRVQSEGKGAGAKSVEGWVIFVTGVHEEAGEDQVIDAFADFGDVKGFQMNLDRRNGFVKGYAAIEYAEETEASDAIAQMDGQELLGQTISVDWAFVSPSEGKRRHGGGGGGGSGGGGGGGGSRGRFNRQRR
ncbi:putative polyadenylate-binding protein [Tribonema minus]|uniref:Putative polyadenylate-binding protein n=1 Tax=Tribonema minus TaxID=303371 RepID=A0A836CN09_9STRA|nr:putative polyadenylate-binding protein [Tribonema minus]